METENVKIEIEIESSDLKIADNMMRKMLRALTTEDLLQIKESRVIKTVAQIDMDSGFYAEGEDGR